MAFLKNIYSAADRPVGRTTLGKLTAALAVFLVLVSAFAYLAREVIEGETLHDDRRVLLKLNHFATPTLDHIVVVLTSFGDIPVVLAIAAGILGFLAYRKKWQAFTQVAFGIAGAALLNLILKTLFERDRPHLWQWIVHESSYSFPSGHATMTAALAFTLMLLAWRTKYRYLAVVGGLAYMIIIGLTRLYLGVHYPTDILAGWCVSLAWVLIVATVLGAINWQPLSKKLR